MHASTNNPNVNDAFFQPIHGLAAASPHARPCPEYSDDQWLRVGIQRVLEPVPSGRALLQEHGPRLVGLPGRSNYFASLHSPRRRDLAQDVNLAVIAAAVLPDRLEHIPELDDYECFALDGHWHKAATHDERHEGSKMAVGHFYGLNLRTHTLRHLAVGEGLHEHDTSALKRIKPGGLRQDVPKGTRVLIVYDKACIDYGFWKRCRQECAVYFLSRVKDGMVFDWLESRLIDKGDGRNRGVGQDRLVMAEGGHRMRIVFYTDPESGKEYEFLTNEMDLPPGVIAELYRRRWEVEKVFDDIKNKLGERKAWGTSLVAKSAQGQLVAITHNLMLMYEQRIEEEHGVSNSSEDERRGQRVRELRRVSRRTGRAASSLILGARRATQRSVKFVRWLRHALREKLAESVAVTRLAQLYASM
jgi:hypothetical protein